MFMNNKTIVFICILLITAIITGCSGNSNSGQSQAPSQTQNNSGNNGGNSGEQPATAEVNSFYEDGQTIELIVPFGAGGGTDVATRFITPFMTKYTDGNPPIQVVNIPGAAAINGTNEFVLRKHDGYTILGSSSSVLVQWLMGREEVKFDIKTMIPIVGMPHNSIMSISPDTGYKEPKDLLNPQVELAWGASDPTGGDVRLILGLEVLKVADNVNMVFGYDGSGPARVAFEQGETNLDSQTTSAYLSNVVPLEQEGKSVPLFQIGMLNANGDIIRDPAVPHIMTVPELYFEMYGEEPSGELYEAYKIFGGLVNNMHKTIFIHGDAPEEAVSALKTGVERALEDPEFLEQAEDILGTKDLLVGADLNATTEMVKNIDDDVVKYVRKLMTEKYGATGLSY